MMKRLLPPYSFWHYNLFHEMVTYTLGCLIVYLTLTITLDELQEQYLKRQVGDASQVGLFLQNHLNQARDTLVIFASLPPDEQSTAVADLLPAFSDLYRLDAEWNVLEIFKSIPSSQVFHGFSFRLGGLREYLAQQNPQNALSHMMRGYEDSRASVYHAVGLPGERYLGRLDLGYLEEFLQQFTSFSGTPALLVTNDGFVMLSSDSQLRIPAIDIDTWSTTPRIDRPFVLHNQNWIPVLSAPLDINAHVVTLISTQSLEEQRTFLLAFLFISLLSITILLVLKNIRLRQLFIIPFEAFAERMHALERGQFPMIQTIQEPTPFRELVVIQERFHAMSRAIQERERSLAEISQQAQAASLAKTAFLANMSHEIRTPMNAMLGLTQYLKQEALHPEQQAIVHNLYEASASLLAILNDILDLSKIEANEITIENRPFSVAEMLQQIHNLFAMQAAAKGLILRIASLPPTSGLLLGDATRIQQVLTNLVSNAIKFTPAGRVELRVQTIEEHPDTPLFQFTIQDTGIGISQVQLKNLFSPFFQVDQTATRQFGGTGLGLSICKRLVDLMGGTIQVQSQLGIGSAFCVTLPLQRALQAVPLPSSCPASNPDLPQPRLRGLHVLVVDDSATNRFLLQKVLVREGARVSLAEDGAQVLSLIRDPLHTFSLVLMDVQMPILDGITAIRHIRHHLGLRDLPMIAVTAGVLGSQYEAALQAGANQVLLKPLELEQTIQCIQLLTQHVRKDPSVHASLPPAPTPSSVTPAVSPTVFPAVSPTVFPTTPKVADFPAPALPDHSPASSVCGLDMALLRLNGDQELFQHLLQVFFAEYGAAPQQILADLQRGDPTAGLRRLHSLRGTAAQLGAEVIATLAARLEAILRQDPSADMSANLTELTQHLNTLHAQSFPSAPSSRQGSSLPHPFLPLPDPVGQEKQEQQKQQEQREQQTAKPGLQHLRIALQEQDLQALDLFDVLQNDLTLLLGAQRTQQIAADLRGLRYASALQLLDHFVQDA